MISLQHTCTHMYMYVQGVTSTHVYTYVHRCDLCTHMVIHAHRHDLHIDMCTHAHRCELHTHMCTCMCIGVTYTHTHATPVCTEAHVCTHIQWPLRPGCLSACRTEAEVCRCEEWGGLRLVNGSSLHSPSSLRELDCSLIIWN